MRQPEAADADTASPHSLTFAITLATSVQKQKKTKQITRLAFVFFRLPIEDTHWKKTKQKLWLGIKT